MSARSLNAMTAASVMLPSVGTWGRLCRSVVFCTALLAAATTTAVAGETIVYSQGFEASDGGYTHTGTNDSWQWDTPNYAPGPASAHSGTKCWGTNLTGDVPASADMYLRSPAIAIPALGADQIARVRFWGWLSIDNMYDRGDFQVSADGNTWTSMAEFFNQMQGGWCEYCFNVSAYAGGNLYLRWRCYTDGGSTAGQAGFYVDDVAVVITTLPATRTVCTLEAWEYPNGSCPWVCPWDGKGYAKDNDVYSTARGAAREYRDFYLLQKPLVAKKGQYLLELRETDQEMSYTDLVQLMVVDHPKGVRVAPDNQGNVWPFGSPRAPASARDGAGTDVAAALASEDGVGVKAFNGSTLELDFSNLAVTQGATLVLRAKGFLADGPPGAPTGRPPRIEVSTQDAGGAWVSRGIFYPRVESALCAYNLQPFLGASRKVRLTVSSCHVGKYHLIDYAALDTAPRAPVNATLLAPASATYPAQGDALAALRTADNTYVTMSPQSAIALAFPVPKKAGDERSFVFVSEGYYVPTGSFFLYTWDGSAWAQRDGWTVGSMDDQTRTFDLSLWLPDPTGQYRVRIWQDYRYEPAGIDFVGLTRGGTPGTLSTATDLRGPTSVLTQLSASDDNRLDWGSGGRDRWVEAVWTGLAANTPPTTNPVAIPNPASATPTINWTYNDAEASPQAQYEVQVWTGPGGTGTCVWNPTVGTGTGTSVVYAGTPLVNGQTYYARVRAFDGNAWGGWSETNWTYDVSSTAPRILKTVVAASLYLMATDDPPDDREVVSRLLHAHVHVMNSLAAKRWVDDSHLTSKGGEVFTQESRAVKYLLPLLDMSGLDQGFLADIQSAIDDLVLADKQLAETAIGEAEAAVGQGRAGAKDLEEARRHYNAGLADTDAGRYRNAIADFHDAWSSAQAALHQALK